MKSVLLRNEGKISEDQGNHKLDHSWMVRTHQDLAAWKKSMNLVESVYRWTESFPASERYGLVSQMRRSAISIPANIAKGAARRSTKEFVQFLYIARASLSELCTQLEISKRLRLCGQSNERTLQLNELFAVLNGLIRSLRKPK